MRTSLHIEHSLSGALRDTYRTEHAQLVAAVAGQPEGTAAAAMRAHAGQVLAQAYGIEPEMVGALERLAAEQPAGDERLSAVEALVERVALLRACSMHGLAGALGPYLRAAARGAREGFALDAGLLLPNLPSGSGQ